MTALLPLVALLVACGSAEHAPRAKESALTPTMGTAGTFAVLAGETVTNTGPSTIAGNVGVSPGTAVTGFPPALQTAGAMHLADAVALRAQSDAVTAYDQLAGAPCTRDLTGVDLGGLTLGEGVYCFASSAQLTGTVTLDAKGNPDALFIFKTVSTLITASNASVLVINGGSGCNVYWKVGSSATLGTNTVFVGTVIALSSVALQTGASLEGRALARNGAVTLDDNHVALATCGSSVDAGGTDAGPVDTGATDAGPSETATGDDAGIDTAPPPCDPSMEGDCI